MENPIITVVYSHGRYGSPWYGFKIEALRPVALKLGLNMISVRYPEEMTVDDMEQKLLGAVADDVNVPGDVVFLSSSRGGYLSTRVSRRTMELYSREPTRRDEDKLLPKRHVLGQFLIAPAFYIKPEYYGDQAPAPPNGIRTRIVHGLEDKVISCENSIKFSRLFNAQLHLIEGGHRLNSQRDRLCLLFEDFLRDCIKDADAMFSAWKEENPQREREADDISPRAAADIR
jgi:hypothetical protein